jgi:hypothetical protein
MQHETLRVSARRTQSVQSRVTTQSVGTIWNHQSDADDPLITIDTAAGLQVFTHRYFSVTGNPA